MSDAGRPVEFGIHQVLAAASPHDAITNAALEFRDILRRVAPSEVFARHVAPAVAADVRPLGDYQAAGSRGLIIYHASIGEPMVSAFLLSRPEPIVLVYHNITPPEYFKGLDDTFAELLELGRLELEELRHRVRLAIADSHFNAAELEAIGYEDVRVIPPVVDPYRLVRTEPDKGMLHHVDRTFDAPIALFVGQLLPHKRPDLLVETLHVANTYLGLRVFLVLAGHNRFVRYAGAVSAQIRELNLPTAHVVGSLDDPRLAAMFTRARVFITMSEHEGFCVPLLEAMAFGVPIIARACTAIPETLGEAGMLIPSNAGPKLAAEALLAVAEDQDLHADLAAAGHRRLNEITANDPTYALLEAIESVA